MIKASTLMKVHERIDYTRRIFSENVNLVDNMLSILLKSSLFEYDLVLY